MSTQKNQSPFLSLLFVSFIYLFFLSCDKEDTEDDNSSATSDYKGTWVRLIGASGDETDIAIGNISGESSDRVYMCEWKGNVGLYKGLLSGNIIHWDASYALPDAQIGLENGKLTFVYPSVSNSIKTYYSKGSWSSHCGPLSNSGSTQTHPKGQFKIIVNKPTGSCASSNTASHNLAWVAGTVVTSTFDQNGNESGSTRVINQGYGPLFTNPNSTWTYYSLSNVSKLYWGFFPDASSWPSSCSQTGSSLIDYEGQIKTIVIW